MSAVIRRMSDSAIQLPEVIVVDTSLLLGLGNISSEARWVVAHNFLRRLSNEALLNNVLILIPLVVMMECYHKTIQWHYEMNGFKGNWTNAGYKSNPILIQGAVPQLTQFRQNVINLPAAITGPDDLIVTKGFVQPIESTLLDNIGKFNLLSADAEIIAESEHLGVTDLATMDNDWSRADGFTVYLP